MEKKEKGEKRSETTKTWPRWLADPHRDCNSGRVTLPTFKIEPISANCGAAQ